MIVDSCGIRCSTRLALGLVLFAAGSLHLRANGPDQPVVYTHALDIKRLPANESAKEHPVSIRAVVTFFDRQFSRWFVQDDTSGISIISKDSRIDGPLAAGDFISVDGVTTPGAFSGAIAKARIVHLGVRPLPQPERPAFEDLISGESDSSWVEVTGIVRSGQIGRGRLRLNVKVPGGSLIAVLNSYPLDWNRSFIDSKVSLSGAVAQIAYQERQSIGVRIFVPPGSIRILERGAADPFSLPDSSAVTDLGYRRNAESEHRIRVRGVVVGVEPGQSLFLAGKDEKYEIRGDPPCVAEPGDVIDAVGFPGAFETRPGLLDSICRAAPGKVNFGAVSLAAVSLRAEQVLASQVLPGAAATYVSAASSRHDMTLVRMQGTLLQNSPGSVGSVLRLASGGKQFLATLPGANQGILKGLGEGSILQLTGICLLSYDEYRRPQSFRLLLRTPSDVLVLKAAPWWNLENALRVLSVMAFILMGAIVWVVRQSIQLRRANKALRKLSFQDALTGVANRRKFDITLEKELRRAARSSTPISLIMIDIDFFKRLNDRYGHQKGDECLVLVARALQSTRKRFSDLVARYGGEEFAIILPGSESASAIRVAEAAREAVIGLSICHEDSPFLYVSISAGIATIWPDRENTSACCIALADQALYQSKSEGRNRVSHMEANVAQGVF